jgi:microcystin-dependent protein
MTFQATEALTHLRFSAKVKWNEVTLDAGGHGTKIDSYEVQLRATNSGGTPVETEDDVDGDAVNDTRIRIARKQPVQKANVTVATAAASVATFTTRRDHGFAIGDRIKVSGMTPSGYNGNWVVATVPTTTQLTANIGSTPAAGTDFGIIEDRDDKLHVVTRTLPRPKTWYWQARVRAVDSDQCQGNWSAWTTAALPWTGADPAPPVPTFGGTPITFERIGVEKKRQFRLKFTFDEVVNWDVPGADREDDMRAYLVVVDRSDDGTTWDGTPWYRKRLVMAKQDADADTTRTVVFNVGAKQWYRCKVRAIDRFGRHGAFSSFTSGAFPNDNTQPPQVSAVRIHDQSTNRVAVDWDEPTANYETRGTVAGTSGTATLTGTSTKFDVEVEPGTVVRVDANNYKVKKVTSATALTLTTNLSTSPSGAKLYVVEEHFDVAYYDVQIAKSADVDTAPTPDEWSDFYFRDRTQGTRRSFRIPTADLGLTFFGRVRSVDMARNKAKWVYATTAGNSDPNVSGQGVTIGAGSLPAAPGTPANPSLAFDVAGTRHARYRASVTAGVSSSGGTPDHYVLQLVHHQTTGASPPAGARREHHNIQGDATGDDLVEVFRNIPKNHYVWVRERAVNAGGKSAWTGWIGNVQPSGTTTPSAPANVTVTHPFERRWVVKWDEPDDEEAVRWKVVWKQGVTVKDTTYTRNNKDVYRAPKADAELTHTAEVTTFNAMGVESSLTSNNAGGSAPVYAETGTVRKFAMSGIPSGWLECDGTSKATATYPDLFGVIGYTYGGGGASFNVPDIKNRKVKGKGSLYALAGNEGSAEGGRDHNHGHSNHRHGGHGHASHRHGNHNHTSHKHNKHPHDDHTGDTTDQSGGHDHGSTPLTVTGTTNTTGLNLASNTTTGGGGDRLTGGGVATHDHSAGALDVGGTTGAQGSSHKHSNASGNTGIRGALRSADGTSKHFDDGDQTEGTGDAKGDTGESTNDTQGDQTVATTDDKKSPYLVLVFAIKT